MTRHTPGLLLLALAPLASATTAMQQPGHRPAEPVGERMTLVTEDEVKIAALLFRAAADAPRPLLILLHGGNRRKERWVESGFVRGLAPEGYHMIALDIRGRGESESGDERELSQNPALAIRDVVAALDWAEEQDYVDRSRVALVGSSYGANLAVAGCLSRPWNVRTVVCLSATAASIRWLPQFPDLHPIPSALYLGCVGEPARYDVVNTARFLAEHTKGTSRTEMFEGAYHAISLFQFVDEIPDLVRAWLRTELGAPSTEPAVDGADSSNEGDTR